MKKIYFLSCLLLSVINGFAQNVFPTSGNVGIGTTSPVTKLDVEGDIKSNTTTYNYYTTLNLSSQNQNTWFPVVLAGNSLGGPVQFEIVRTDVHQDGNWYGTLHFIGIFNSSGWGNSGNQFEYKYEELTNGYPGNLVAYVGQQFHGSHIIIYLRGGRHYNLRSSTPVENVATIGLAYTINSGNLAAEIIAKLMTNIDDNPPTAIPSGGTEYVVWKKVMKNTALASSGNIIIGTSYESNPNYKLDVNGDLRANKVVVNTTGADYVFDSTYHLPSIDSLHAFIVEYHHLPDMPSAQELKDSGSDMGEMQRLQLQKIEELTLYVIKQDETIQRQQEMIEELQKK